MSVRRVRYPLSLVVAIALTTGLSEAASHAAKTAETAQEKTAFAGARRQMVERDFRDRGIDDQHVLAAMQRVPRERFLPPNRRDEAYADEALQIGCGQTISRPYIVALMTELVRPSPKKRALDIGTGSGYQAAVLAELCREVNTIEIVRPLADSAQKRLLSLGYHNIHVRCGDGYRGWPEKAPFDVIVVARRPTTSPGACQRAGPRRPAGDSGRRRFAKAVVDRKERRRLGAAPGDRVGEVRSDDGRSRAGKRGALPQLAGAFRRAKRIGGQER